MSLVSFDQQQNSFILKYPYREELMSLYFSCPLEFKGILEEVSDISRYSFFEFYKQCPENDIFPLVLDDKIIGMIFPIQALLSNSHNKSEDKSFLKNAYVTYENYLNKLTPKKLEKIINNKKNSLENLTLVDIYSEDTVFVVIYRELILERYNFCINDQSLISSLFKKGYFLQENQLPSDFIPSSIQSDLSHITKIAIKHIPESICREEYIKSFFKDLIFETHPLAQFHFKYQIIELLMEKVLYDQLEKLNANLKNKRIVISEFQHSIKSFSSEDKRIKLLFSKYSSVSESELKNELVSDLKIVLTDLGRLEAIAEEKVQEESKSNKNSISLEMLLYKFRNLVVHDYRSIKEDKMEVFVDINKQLNILLINLLRNFHIPS